MRRPRKDRRESWLVRLRRESGGKLEVRLATGSSLLAVAILIAMMFADTPEMREALMRLLAFLLVP